MKIRLISIFFVLFYSTLFAQFLEKEKSTSLAPLAQPKPNVFGISFASSPSEVIVDMHRFETSLLHFKKIDSSIGYQIFRGTPPFSTQGTSSYMKYFNDKLVSMSFKFSPSFSNYLILKDQLLDDLGSRYKVKKDDGHIEPFLKAELLNISGSGIPKEIEEKLTNSILAGKTFFYLPLEDKKKEVEISLYWIPSPELKKTMLAVNYTWVKGEEALKKLKKAKEKSRSVLPQ